MPTVDFAAAQERLAARRRQREAQAQSRISAQRAAHDASLSRLPYPLSQLGHTGLNIWDSIKGREGTKPAFRVGQVDAELLDEELLELLQGQVGEALKYYGSHLRDDYSAEVLLVLRAVLFKLTIWDHNASYGASLQGLRYTDARDTSLARPPPTRWQKALYGLITVGGRYSWTKWESHLLSQTEDYTHPPTRLQALLTRLTSTLTTTHSITAVLSFLIFLYNGHYRTLLDRILRLRLSPTTHAVSREVSFEYLNRQLVWHAFTEFLLFLLPLVGISRWRRILSRSWRRVSLFLRYTLLGLPLPSASSTDEEKTGELSFLPRRTCAICYSSQTPTTGLSEAEILNTSAAGGGGGLIGSAATDITNPYEAVPCGCVYCYSCLAQRIEGEEGEAWVCLRCGVDVKRCGPWSGDVIVAEERPHSKGKTVGFAGDDESTSQARGLGIPHDQDIDGGYGEAEDHDHNPEHSYNPDESTMVDIDPAPIDESISEDVEDSTNYLTQSEPVDVRASSSGLLGDSSEWARASSDYDSSE